MKFLLPAVLFILACASGSVTASDLIGTPECQRARVALDAAFESFARRRADASAQLRQARERAAQACFGTTLAGQAASAASAASASGKAPPVARAEPSVQPPIAVAPPDLQLRPALTLSVPKAAPPVVPPPVHSTVTNCDAGGCWDNQGRRISRVGPTLVGPNGPCTVQGVFATCP